jgi:CHAD domain-containing protein
MAKDQRPPSGAIDFDLPNCSIRKRSSGADVFVAAFRAEVERVVRLAGAIGNDTDANQLHDLRTAVRRLRSHLRTFRPLLSREWAESLRAELGWFNLLMAKARNVDVLIELLRGCELDLEPSDALKASKLFDRLAGERNDAYDSLRAGMRESRYAMLLDDVIAAAQDPVIRPAASQELGKWKKAILAGARKRLRRAVSAAATPPSAGDLHEIRIKARHLRFAAEVIQSVAGKRIRTIARQAERLQDVLGGHHDAIVGLTYLQDLYDDAGLVFAEDRLAERLRRQALEYRSRWRRALKTLLQC